MTLEIFLQQSFLIIRFKNLMQLVNAGTTFMDLACRMAVDYPLKITRANNIKNPPLVADLGEKGGNY